MVHITTGTAMITAARMMIRCKIGVYSRIFSSFSRITQPPRSLIPGESSRLDAALLEFLSNLGREIRQYPVGTGPLDRDQPLHHRFFAVEPAIARSRRYHRIFAGHLVGEGRHRERIFY